MQTQSGAYAMLSVIASCLGAFGAHMDIGMGSQESYLHYCAQGGDYAFFSWGLRP